EFSFSSSGCSEAASLSALHPDPTPRDPDTPTPRDPENPTPRDPDTPRPRHPETPRPRHPETPTPREPDTPRPRHPDTPRTRHPETPTPREPDTPRPRHPENPTPREPDTPRTRHPDTPRIRHPETPTPRHPDTPRTRHPDTPRIRHPETPTPRHPETPTPRHPETPTPRDGTTVHNMCCLMTPHHASRYAASCSFTSLPLHIISLRLMSQSHEHKPPEASEVSTGVVGVSGPNTRFDSLLQAERPALISDVVLTAATGGRHWFTSSFKQCKESFTEDPLMTYVSWTCSPFKTTILL
ncbi:uncharacterized protein LOC142937863, partial [Anarhichas minor]|uniref:uncharacterized protein LOC142937863 n=1 Tax=Anarhichas minor TaxID=65739 RepID=UPI003F73A679